MIGFAASERYTSNQETPVPDTLKDLRRDLATAYRIVANEGILDAFGHISVRNPNNPQRYFLSRSRAPALVQPDDILEYDLDSNPIVPPMTRPYSERVIHGEIFKARPDVNAVCHHHAPSIMPFAISGVPLVPVFHLGAAMGRTRAVLGQPRRIRRHQPAGGEAGGGRLARACARAATRSC